METTVNQILSNQAKANNKYYTVLANEYTIVAISRCGSVAEDLLRHERERTFLGRMLLCDSASGNWIVELY
jgi:hypothetical protein